MEIISSNLCSYIKLEHKETGNLYAVSKLEWEIFCENYSSRNLTTVSLFVRAIKLQKNNLNQYDLSEEAEIINYESLRGTFAKDLMISC